MAIRGTEGLSDAELAADIAAGGRFVYYMFCVSVVVMTFRRASQVTYVRAGRSRVAAGLGWSLLTLVAGWWGIPWGPVYSVQSIVTNLSGGRDVTAQVTGRPLP